MSETTTFYDFPEENIRKKFTSRDEALKYVKDKLPANGKDWVLRKTVTTIEEETIESTRKLIENKDIIKRIIDAFIEKATINNVKFSTPGAYKCTNEKYANISHSVVDAYYFAEKIGFPWEKLDDWFNNKDGILEGRFDEWFNTDEKPNYNNRDITDFIAEHLALWYMVSDKFNIDLKDITEENYNYGSDERYKVKGNKSIHYKDPTTLAGKYPEAKKYIDENNEFLGIYNSGIYVEMDKQEALDLYKEKLKNYPIEHAVVYYNVGDYRPCHNYKIEFPYEFEPGYRGEGSLAKLGETFYRMPGIMFRNDDIYITGDNYIGRHVHHTGSKKVDETEELYNYCVKNL